MPEQVVVRARLAGDRRVRPVGTEVLDGTNVSALQQQALGVGAARGRGPRRPPFAVVTTGARAGGAQESGGLAVLSAGTGHAVLVESAGRWVGVGVEVTLVWVGLGWVGYSAQR